MTVSMHGRGSGAIVEVVAVDGVGHDARRRASSPIRRLAGLVAVVALAGFLVGEQVALSAFRLDVSGMNVHRPAATTAPPVRLGGDDAARLAEADGIDVQQVIENIRHHVVPDATRPGTLTVQDDVYRATFDGRGFQVGGPGAEPWFALSLTAVTRGGQALPPDVGPWAADANVASRSVAAGATEQVTARQGELEWDVVLSSPPPGSGAVRVEATVQGGRPRLVGGAWRWQHDGGGHLDMGELVVLDAAGAELYRALPSVVDDQLALDVPEAVLRGAAYPVTIDPELGPEHPVSPSRIHRPAEGGPTDVAFDGTNYLVVFNADGGSAARIDRSGRLLDRTPIAITGLYRGGAAAVEFDGTNYLVVWSGEQSEGDDDLMGSRVSPAGVVLDPDGFLIAEETGDSGAASVEFDGTNHLVTWDVSDCCGPGLLGAIRVDPQGRVVDPAPRTFVGPQWGARLEFGGRDHLAVWTDDDGVVRAARLGPDGALLAPGVFPLSTSVGNYNVAVAFDGASWQVFWSGPAGPYGIRDVVGIRVSLAGTVLDPAPRPIATAAGDQTEPYAARSGDQVVVVWTDERGDGDVYTARVDRSGTVLTPEPIAVATGPGEQHAGPLAAGDDRLLATIRGSEDGSCCFTQAVRLTDTGRVLDPTPLLVSYESNSQFDPKLAFDGTNYLVAWNDDRDDQFQRSGIYVARVTPSGVSLDPAGIRVGFVTGEYLTDVVFDGENFIVGINRVNQPEGGDEDWDVYVTVVTRAGELVTPTPVPVVVGQDNDLGARLSPDGTNTVVFWSRIGGGIMAARITRTGVVLDPGGVLVSPGETGVASPAAAFDGSNHLLVYPSGADEPYGNGTEVVTRRVSPTLEVLDPESRPITSSPGSYVAPEVAWGGTNHLVVWNSYRTDVGYRAEGARVAFDGTVLEPGVFRLTTAEDEQSGPTVASLNGWFLVTWTRQRWRSWPGDNDVVGARVHESGARLDPEGFVIVDNAVSPDVVAGAGGRWTTAYRVLDDREARAERVFLRQVSPK
jgi:hypothetical protein